jgi:hypothetical protein
MTDQATHQLIRKVLIAAIVSFDIVPSQMGITASEKRRHQLLAQHHISAWIDCLSPETVPLLQ